MRGQSWSLRDGNTSCPWLTPHCGGAVSPCSTQGCSLPAAWLLLWQQFPLQLLGFSLAAPGAKHNTSLPLRLPAAPAALCFQSPKAGSSASLRGSPPRVLLHPQDLLPSQAHIWGWHSSSPAGPRTAFTHPSGQRHSAFSLPEAISWDISWTQCRARLLATLPHPVGAAILEQG